MDTVKAKKPPFAILENVMGILHFMDDVEELLVNSWPDYIVYYFKICPRQLGHPVARPRVYFLCLRQDMVLMRDPKYLANLGQKACCSEAEFMLCCGYMLFRPRPY